MAQRKFRNEDALLLVDVQRDFFPGGPMEVPDAEAIIPVLNDWIHEARDSRALIVVARDWHTVDHASFESQGGPWPPHCVQDTPGSFFHPSLRLPERFVVVSKGTAFNKDSESAFDGTGLEHFLRQRGITRLWIGGLAEDESIRHTVEDACRHGFETHLIVEGTRALDPATVPAVLEALTERGVRLEHTL